MKSAAWQKVVTQRPPLNALSFLKLDHDHSPVELSANLHARQARWCLASPARSLSSKAEAAPFFGAISLFVLAYAGIAISLYPMIVPYQLTLWEAASSPRTQAFLLVGTLFLLPVILTYSGWSYWVFRGKVRADVGYEWSLPANTFAGVKRWRRRNV
jgi:hypothetical protein